MATPLLATTTIPTVPQAPVAAAELMTSAPAPAQTRPLLGSELLSKQANDVIAQDSPLMQQAATRAKQEANRLGLLNTSMAVQAGQAAVMDRALPIAQYDAAANSNVLDRNLANQQQTSQFNAGQTQQSNQFNTQNQLQNEQFKATLQNQAEQFNASQTNQVLVTNLNNEARASLADVEANYKTLMQTSESASQMYQSIIDRIAQVASLSGDVMDADSKAATINSLQDYLKSGLNVIGSVNGIDVGSLLTFE